MRTLIIIAGGLTFYGLCWFASRWLAPDTASALAAKIFIPLWLAAAAYNMWVGVTRAGYSVAEELPIFLLIFAVPAALAAVRWWQHS